MKKLKPGQAIVAVHLALLCLIIVPFFLYEGLFERLSAELLSGTRSFEIFIAAAFLLAIDVFAPIPSSAVSISAGMLLGAPLAFLASLFGLTLGSLLGYGFGYYFRKLHFDRWYADPEFRNLSSEFSRYGYAVLLICRGVPILAEMSVMVAGFHRYTFGKFVLVTFAGNCVLAFLYSYMGNSAINLTSAYLLTAVFLLVPFLTFSARFWWLRRQGEA